MKLLNGDDKMDCIKVGRFIAERRKKLGYTQNDVAEKPGLSDKAV